MTLNGSLFHIDPACYHFLSSKYYRTFQSSKPKKIRWIILKLKFLQRKYIKQLYFNANEFQLILTSHFDNY